MGEGGGLGFYLGFPNLEVGKWFLLGGGQKAQDTESFFKVTPLIWAMNLTINSLVDKVLDTFVHLLLVSEIVIENARAVEKHGDAW